MHFWFTNLSNLFVKLKTKSGVTLDIENLNNSSIKAITGVRGIVNIITIKIQNRTV